MRALLSRRSLARFTGLLLAVATTAVLIGIAGVAPAAAATCRTIGHVYVNGGLVKTQFDPIEGPVGDLVVPFGSVIKLGGNGMRPGENPFWAAYREIDGAHMPKNLAGNRAGDNCVANEKTFLVDLPRGTYIVRAWYYLAPAGEIHGQQHFRLVVV
jgi:hypothetical protein